jgi:adenosylhomocysteinase
MLKMKNGAIVCNIGHFDSEIQVEAIKKYKWTEREAAGPPGHFPSGRNIMLLAEGRLVNLGCATGHPSFVMSNSFTNQVHGADRAVLQDRPSTRSACTPCPSTWTRKVARLHLGKLGVKLDKLSSQAGGLPGRAGQGPVQARHYRY